MRAFSLSLAFLNDNPTRQQAVTDDAFLAVLPPSVLDLDRDTAKDQGGVREIQSTLGQRLGALDRIEGDPHGLLYLQQAFDQAAEDGTL